MSQIMEFERPFNVVFGNDGAEAQIIPGPDGPDFPIWRARQMVMAVLTAQLDKTTDEGEREEFQKLRQAFRFAETGDLVFGMIRHFKNRKGVKRFIGIAPKGVDYREVGPPKAPPTRHAVPRFDSALMHGVPRQAPQAKPQMSDAERIADKMAKASRKAVEGSE